MQGLSSAPPRRVPGSSRLYSQMTDRGRVGRHVGRTLAEEAYSDMAVCKETYRRYVGGIGLYRQLWDGLRKVFSSDGHHGLRPSAPPSKSCA